MRRVGVRVLSASFRMAVSVSGPGARVRPALVAPAVALVTDGSRELALELVERPSA